MVEIKKQNIFENKKYGEIFNINLNGQLVSEFSFAGGINPPYEALMYKEDYLLSIFSKNWGKFEILEEKTYLDAIVVNSSCTDTRPYLRVNDYIYNKFNLTNGLEEFIIYTNYLGLGNSWIISSKTIGGSYTYNFNGLPIFNNGSIIAKSSTGLNGTWANGNAGTCLPLTSSSSQYRLTSFQAEEFVKASSDQGLSNYRKITWKNGSLKPNTLYNFYYRNTSDVYTSAAQYSTNSPDLSTFDLSDGSCGGTIAKYAPAGYFEYNVFRGTYRSDGNGGCALWMAVPLILFGIGSFCSDNLINYAKANLTAATTSNPNLFFLREIKQYDTIFAKDNILVKSISFPKDSYKGLITYQIELENSLYSNNVKDINNQYNFSEDKNGIVQINHQVSAKGLNTSNSSSFSNALENAVSFVQGYTGISFVPSGYFTKAKDYILLESKEYIDRTNSSYSIEESFSSTNLYKSGVLNYTVDIASGKGAEALKIDLRGSLTCGKTYNIDNVQNNLRPIDLVKNYYSGYLNTIPLNYSINKDIDKNQIDFNYTFDNLNVPNPYVKYFISKNTDKINELTNISITVNFQTRGNYKVILLNGESFLSNANDLTAINMPVAPYQLARKVYYQNPEYTTSNRNLSLLNTSKIKNPYQNTYEYQLSYTDKIIPSGFKDGSYSFQYELPVEIVKPNQCVEGSRAYVFQQFNIKNLGKLKINADLLINKDNLWTGNKPLDIDKQLFIVTSDNTTYNKNMGSIKYNTEGIKKPSVYSNAIFGLTVN